MKIRIAQFGLGPIGLEALRFAALKPGLEIVGGIDNAPEKAGRDLGELLGLNVLKGCRVSATMEELLEQATPDVVLHTAVSRFSLAAEQLEPVVRQGISVVSSCEEMVFPWLREPETAKRLHEVCIKTGARVVATGVNPGFVMDVLPICLTRVCCEVREIHVQRVVNASTRREPLQRKIGSGLAPEEFHRRFKAGNLGHAGLRESLALLAYSQGWEPEQIVETGEPMVAPRDTRTRYVEVKQGATRGLHQRAEARVKGRLRASLDLKMYLDAENPRDAIQIQGDPPLDLVLNGGVAGDQATVAALVNTVARVRGAAPGLLLLTDLPLGGVSPAGVLP